MSFGTVSVVGASPVACEIAIDIARVGMAVTLVRSARGGLDLVESRVDRRIRWQLDSGHLSPTEAHAIVGRIEIEKDLSAVSQSDLVIESSFGDLRSRRALLATLEGKLSSGAVLASNCASSQLAAVSEVVRRRDQFVAMRFMHPNPSKQLELGFLADTAPGVMAACRTFCGWLSLIPTESSQGTPRVGYREFLIGAA